MALSFPSSPTVGQVSAQNGRTYTWSGYAWELTANVNAHASSHATGGSDALTYSDIGAAASSHSHAASAITSGTIDPARLGSGASSTTFLRGDSTYQTLTNGTNGASAGVPWYFSTTTTSGDPGSGYFRFNSATISAVTAIYISANDISNSGRGGFFGALGTSTNPSNKGILTFAGLANTNTVQFTVTGTPTNNSTWYSVPVTFLSGAGLYSNNATAYGTFARTGDAGSNASATTSASDLTSGTLAAARLPLATTSTVGGVIVGTGLSVSSGTVSANVTSVAGRTGAVTIASGDVSGLATSATTDATNATNISAGTLAAARLPAANQAAANLYLWANFR